jgi:hypothetical protein
VGQVQVLKTNMYTLESGEPSILQKETSVGVTKARGGKMLRAGVDYFNLTFCMVCGEDELHGDIVMCDGCPVTLHVKCLEYESLEEFEADHTVARGVSKFYCPHHTCSGKAAVFLLPCLKAFRASHHPCPPIPPQAATNPPPSVQTF